MGSYTLNSINLGDVAEETQRKEANLSPTPMYDRDSDETDVFDFGGCTRVITVMGKYSDTNANMTTFIESIEAMIQGHQDNAAGFPVDFVSDMRGTIKVKVAEFEWTKIEGIESFIAYTIKLFEANILG